MAKLKDTEINGNLVVNGNITSGSADFNGSVSINSSVYPALKLVRPSGYPSMEFYQDNDTFNGYLGFPNKIASISDANENIVPILHPNIIGDYTITRPRTLGNIGASQVNFEIPGSVNIIIVWHDAHGSVGGIYVTFHGYYSGSKLVTLSPSSHVQSISLNGKTLTVLGDTYGGYVSVINLI